MARVNVNCTHCRLDGVVTTDDIALGSVAGQDFYTFNCPCCRRHNCKEIELRTVGMLRAVGVIDNGPTNVDDVVIRFADELADDTALGDELEQLGRQ